MQQVTHPTFSSFDSSNTNYLSVDKTPQSRGLNCITKFCPNNPTIFEVNEPSPLISEMDRDVEDDTVTIDTRAVTSAQK